MPGEKLATLILCISIPTEHFPHLQIMKVYTQSVENIKFLNLIHNNTWDYVILRGIKQNYTRLHGITQDSRDYSG